MKNLQQFSPALLFSAVLGVALTASGADKAPPPEPTYDTTAMVNLTATVKDIREVPNGRPMEGLHLIVQAGSESLDVYVAPVEFVKIFDVKFVKGDNLKITGSKVEFDGSTVVLASEVTHKTITLVLRDKSGAPLWKYFIKIPQG